MPDQLELALWGRPRSLVLPTQCQRVLEYMREHGSICPREADRKLGIMRLGARIFDLKHRFGFTIRSVPETEPNRYGKPSTFARYFLVAEPDRVAAGLEPANK